MVINRDAVFDEQFMLQQTIEGYNLNNLKRCL